MDAGGLTQGAHLASLEPSGNAVEVEGVVAHTPGDSAFLIAGLIRLTFNTRIHYMISANCTVVYMNIPCP
jgi:hypothetical protein